MVLIFKGNSLFSSNHNMLFCLNEVFPSLRPETASVNNLLDFKLKLFKQ